MTYICVISDINGKEMISHVDIVQLISSSDNKSKNCVNARVLVCETVNVVKFCFRNLTLFSVWPKSLIFVKEIIQLNSLELC